MKTGAMMKDPLITIGKPGPDPQQFPCSTFYLISFVMDRAKREHWSFLVRRPRSIPAPCPSWFPRNKAGSVSDVTIWLVIRHGAVQADHMHKLRPTRNVPFPAALTHRTNASSLMPRESARSLIIWFGSMGRDVFAQMPHLLLFTTVACSTVS